MPRDSLVLLPAFVITLVGAYVQTLVFLNHDVAWVLHSSERLLQGGTFGQEIVAANPPLIWWISAGVAWIAQMVGADPIPTLRVLVTVMIVLGLYIYNLGMRPHLPPRARALLLALLALLLTLGVHRDFAQREQLAVILCLPWVIVSMRRAAAEHQNPIAAFLVGVAAGIAIAFKPHFVVIPMLVSGYVVIRRRSLWPVFAPENIAILATCIAYVAAVWVFAQPYFTDVLPLITQTYWGFESSLWTLISVHRASVLLAVAALILAAALRFGPAVAVPALMALGFLIAAVAQKKGYSYHIYPVIVFAMLSLTIALFLLRRAVLRVVAGALLAFGAFNVATTSVNFLSLRMADGAYGQLTACLIDLAETHVPEDGGYMAISTHPYPGFPISNYSQRNWVAATNSRLFLPSIAKLRSDPDASAEGLRVLALAEAAEWAAMRKDMATAPDLVLVDDRTVRHAIGENPLNFVAFYSEDPEFARIWADYDKISDCGGGISAYQRRNEG